MFPEGLEWTWVQSSAPLLAITSATPAGRTLKLALGPAACAPGGAPLMRRHSPALQSSAMKASVAQLRARLVDAVQAYRAGEGAAAGDVVPDLPLAPLPELGNHVSSDMDFVKLGANQPVGEVRAGASILCARSSVSGETPIRSRHGLLSGTAWIPALELNVIY